MQSPVPRTSALKQGPCGDASGRSASNVTTYRPGETITVVWQETINHPGHYRIAFDPNGDGLFVDPKSFTDVSGGPGVLLDGIADRSTTSADNTYTQQVTLPDSECQHCTLQLIQMMTDKPPFKEGNDDDIYYQCADLVLVREGGSAGGARGVSGADGTGSSMSGGGAGTTPFETPPNPPVATAGSGGKANASTPAAVTPDDQSGCTVPSRRGETTRGWALGIVALGAIVRRRT